MIGDTSVMRSPQAAASWPAAVPCHPFLDTTPDQVLGMGDQDPGAEHLDRDHPGSKLLVGARCASSLIDREHVEIAVNGPHQEVAAVVQLLGVGEIDARQIGRRCRAGAPRARRVRRRAAPRFPGRRGVSVATVRPASTSPQVVDWSREGGCPRDKPQTRRKAVSLILCFWERIFLTTFRLSQ
jgi:hypothetical protein